MTRITTFIALVLLLISTGNTNGQLFTGNGKDTTQPLIGFGLKAGANVQTISGDIWDHGSQAGWIGGFFARMYKNKIGGRVEVLFSGGKISSPVITDSAGNKGDFRTTRLEIPLMVEYSIIPKLAVTAGVQYSNLLTVENLTDISGDIKKIFKQGEFSAIAGLEYKLPWHISIGGRYRYGLSNINNETISGMPGSWSTQAFQLFVCYTIK